MRESLAPAFFGIVAILAIAAAMLHDDRPHLSRNPHHLSE
jgi:hypothetical protein